MKDLLPEYELLSKEQDEAIRYHGHKSMLVTGPPGSGKTVIALYRANELLKSGGDVDIIVYGNVLFSYLKKSLEQLDIKLDVATNTFHKWIGRHVRKQLKRNIPILGDRFTYDWNKLIKWYAERGIPQEFDHLIVDEGQDLPVIFYRFASRMSTSITVFADENQAIFEGANSSIKEIRKALQRFEPKEIRLKKNYRNTKPIARLASLFMVEGVETGHTEEPTRQGELPLLCCAENESQQIDLIVKYAENYKNKQIGVFLPWKKEVVKWYNKIWSKTKVSVQYYVSGKGKGGQFIKPPNFGEDGIFVVTHHSAKGLEFDAVFIPQMQSINWDYSTAETMRFYVACSRPRDRLVMMFIGDQEPQIIKDKVCECELDGEEIVKRYDLGNLNKDQKDQLLVEAPIISKDHKEKDTIAMFLDRIDDTLVRAGRWSTDRFVRICNIIEEEYEHDFVYDKNEFEEFITDRFTQGIAAFILPLIR
ncbi:3'-5' exonuclease [Thermodesulfobacteriota bacterium]